MAAGQPKSERLQTFVSLKLLAYLDLLALKGAFGDDRNDVVRHFIEVGIQRAKRDKFLSEQEIREIERS
jgi:hypothetical protein